MSNDWLDHAHPTASAATVGGTVANKPTNKFTFRLDHADHATETLLYKMDRKVEVVGLQVLKEGTDSGGTVQLKDNGGVAISDAVAAAVDKASVVAATLDVAHRIINAGDNLQVTYTRGSGSSKSVLLVDVLLHA